MTIVSGATRGSAVVDAKRLRKLYEQIKDEPDRTRFLALLDEILMLLEMNQAEENQKARRQGIVELVPFSAALGKT
jgi:hypothetical protein